MDKNSVIRKTVDYVRGLSQGESSGHDWWHIYRVWKNSIKIGKQEKADIFVVQLAALLHDIADWKFNNGDLSIGPKKAAEWLETLKVNETVISKVCEIIKDISFKGAGVRSEMKTIEGMVVQDADRLDAIGAIGVARCFATGAKVMNQEIYNPTNKPKLHNTFEEYKNANTTSINHFYEKLLLLKDLMNTKTARKLAKDRHKFIENFLDEFFAEWNVNR